MKSECVVFVYLPGQVKAVPAGLLSIAKAGRDVSSTFVYGSAYRRRPDAISLDPVELPLSEVDGQVIRPMGGKMLFGVFRDSAPDAWGRLVINERYLRRSKHDGGQHAPANAINLPEVEYLLRSRPDRVGSLDFREKPESEEPVKKISGAIHLTDLVREAHRIAQGKPATFEVETLLRPATGMGGARPKTTIEDPDGLWLAKFPMDDDVMPITRIEHAMLDAERCGIQTIEHKLLKVEGVKQPAFMIRRFDRKASEDAPGQYERIGYFSSLTLLGLDEYDQQLGSYQDIADRLRQRGAAKTEAQQRREVFRRMALNALVNNDDDHLRNHGILRGAGTRISLSPAFDIVPRALLPGVSTVRRLAIRVGTDMEDGGRQATVDKLAVGHEPFGMTMEEAELELACIACEVRQSWRECCQNAGMTSKQILALEETMTYADDVLEALAIRCNPVPGEPKNEPRAERVRQ